MGRFMVLFGQVLALVLLAIFIVHIVENPSCVKAENPLDHEVTPLLTKAAAMPGAERSTIQDTLDVADPGNTIYVIAESYEK